MTAAEFYAAGHEGDPYGAGHSGQDYKGWRAGTLVPAFTAGRLSHKGYHRKYGFWCAERLPDGLYVTWSHLIGECPLDLETSLERNDSVAFLGETGEFADGPHVHVGYGRSPYPWSRPTLDPLPLIQAALDYQLAGGESTPIPTKEELEMGDIRYLHKKADQSAVEYGIFGRELPGGFKVSTDISDGEAWGRVYGRPDGSPWIQNLTREQWIDTQIAFGKLHQEWKSQTARTITSTK